MTTIAWDGDVLAADTLCTGPDDDGIYYGDKVYETPLGLFAGCGDEGPIQAAVEWLRAGGQTKERPPPVDPLKETVGGLLIRPDKTIAVMSEKFYLIDYHPQKAAIGSGGNFALAFMGMGLNAQEAVQRVIDERLDINTGGRVMTWRPA